MMFRKSHHHYPHRQLLFMFTFLQLQLFQFQNSSISFCLGVQFMQQQHQQRPLPSHDITSLIHLQEIPGSKYDPKIINNYKLKHKLGSNFDPEYMSIYPPAPIPEEQDLNSTYYYTKNHSNNKKNLKKLLRTNNNNNNNKKNSKSPTRINNNDVLSNNYESNNNNNNLLDYTNILDKFHGKLRFKFIRKLERFLQVYTSCPLKYKWRDLGVRFWPRYLKEGYCNEPPPSSSSSSTMTGQQQQQQQYSNNNNNIAIKSCSIPAGLYCQPSQQIYKVLLRWHCQNWEHHKRCRWLEIRHPIITSCSCGTCNNGIGN